MVCIRPLFKPKSTVFLLFLVKMKQKDKAMVKSWAAGTSLMVQWLRIHPPMQGTWV